MLKASELRIGNYIMGDAKIPFQVELSDFSDWYNDHNSHEYGDHLHPIPLTEDWLNKAGFTKIDHDIMNDIPKFLDGRCQYVVSITKSHSVVCAYDELDGWQWYLAAIFYLHELQNLYYSLTNEELTINL